MLVLSQKIVNHASVKQLIEHAPEKFLDLVKQAANSTVRKMSRSVGGLTVEEWNIPEFRTAFDEAPPKVLPAKAGDVHPVAALVISGGMNTVFKLSSHTRNIEGKGVSAMVFGKQYTFKDAFVAQMKSGHRGIFERYEDKEGKPGKYGNQKIRELYTISFPQMVEDTKKDRIPPILAKAAQANFEKKFLKDCDAYLKEYKAQFN